MTQRSVPQPNAVQVSLAEVQTAYGDAPWAHPLIRLPRCWATLICQQPTPKPRGHWHPDSDEWWLVLAGDIEWDVEGIGVFRARPGDCLCVPRGHAHRIRVLGDRPAIRLTIHNPDIALMAPDARTPAERRRDLGQSLANCNGQISLDTPAWLPPNLPMVYFEDIKAARGDAPWRHRLLANEHISGELIYELPASAPTGHWHAHVDEWWVVLEGETEWLIEGIGAIRARRHEFVFVEAGRLHQIHAIGDWPSLRLPIATPHLPHLAPEESGPTRWIRR